MLWMNEVNPNNAHYVTLCWGSLCSTQPTFGLNNALALTCFFVVYVRREPQECTLGENFRGF
ncbi:MAG: hypothetical protein ACI84K_001898 [Pseudohongiellaceae bacterium]|jgi:hypothetical protein